MFRELFIKAQSAFVTPDEVAAFRSMIPREVSIQYKIDKDDYIAYLEAVDDKKIKGLLITEGKTEEELNNNLNQLIYMNVNIPEKVRPYYGNSFEFKINDHVAKSGELVLARA